MGLSINQSILTNTPNFIDFLNGKAAKGAVRLIGYGDLTVETAPTGKGLIKAHSTISHDFLNFNPVQKLGILLNLYLS